MRSTKTATSGKGSTADRDTLILCQTFCQMTFYFLLLREGIDNPPLLFYYTKCLACRSVGGLSRSLRLRKDGG